VGSVEKKTFLSAICSRIRCNNKGRFCPPISRVLAFEVDLHRVVVAAAGSDGRRVADVPPLQGLQANGSRTWRP
jgi:hypothetical protein